MVVFQSDREPDALYLKYADEVIPALDAGNEKAHFPDPTELLSLRSKNNIDLIHPDMVLSENPDLLNFALITV